jgi:HPt (histidine-containing phosphotransfer) domain-containing protein
MDGYIPKPIQGDSLFEAVETAVPVGTKIERTPSQTQPAADIIDLVAAAARLDGDIELLKDIAGLFLEECPRLLASLRDAIERNDSRMVERTAHTIKGSVSNFVAKPAKDAAQRLEQIGREGSLDDVREACRVLEQEIEQLKPALVALGRE